jgi:Domain of unknown function (DUF4145)
MTISREHWKPPFATSPLSSSAVPKFPPWLCAGCQSGTLALDKDTFKVVETGVSKGCRAHEAWDADWIDERFAGLLVCQNEACGEIVAIGGRTYHSEDLDWEPQEQNWYREFEPVFMYPPPPVFPIPAKCPKAVSAQLKRAFSLFWSDLGSCANRLRAAAEALLTDRRIPCRRVNDKGKRERILLHLRIEKFKQTDAHSADYLLAIKWLGNAGSHANRDELSREELLDGLELLDRVVELVYVQRDKSLKKIARSINSRRGRPIRDRQRPMPQQTRRSKRL